MTAFTQHDADGDPGTGLRVARCRLPGGRAAAGQVRRTVHGALHGWGLGPVAGDLTDHLTALVQEFLARTASRARGPMRGPIDLRLELRASARLLLGEIHDAAPEPVPEAPGRGIVALTYGRRPARDGTRYIHSFTWWHQDAVTADG